MFSKFEGIEIIFEVADKKCLICFRKGEGGDISAEIFKLSDEFFLLKRDQKDILFKG